MDTRAAVTEATRLRLVEAGIRVLADRGAEGLTMQAVADEAGCALRTLYNHFASRDEVLTASFQHHLDEYRRLVELRASNEGGPRERLHAFVEAYLETYDEQNAVAGLVVRVQGVPHLNQGIEDIRAWRKRQITAILRDAGDELRVPLRQAVAVAFQLTAYASWDALTVGAGLTPSAAKAAAHDMLDATLFGVT
jgi:AcrR family transcriptional regulator